MRVRKYHIAFIACCISCGAPCGNEANGLCVDAHGYPVDFELVSGEVDIVAGIYPDLPNYIGESRLEFVESLSSEGEADAGLYHWDEHLIEVVWKEERGAKFSCTSQYFVVGHELVHFVAEVEFGIPDEANHDHPIAFFGGRYREILQKSIAICGDSSSEL
jgi:hypothetical protein